MYVKIEEKEITITECTTFFKRFLGFMFQLNKIETGLRFPKCRSIHSFFMFQRIDIVMTDQDDKIIYLYHSLPSERIILPKKGVYYTYELPVGSIEKLNIGEYLRVFENNKKTSKDATTCQVLTK